MKNHILLFDYVESLKLHIADGWNEPITFQVKVVIPEIHYKLRIYCAGRKIGTLHIELYNERKNVFNIGFKNHFYFVTADAGSIADGERDVFNKRLTYFIRLDVQGTIDAFKNPLVGGGA